MVLRYIYTMQPIVNILKRPHEQILRLIQQFATCSCRVFCLSRPFTVHLFLAMSSSADVSAPMSVSAEFEDKRERENATKKEPAPLDKVISTTEDT